MLLLCLLTYVVRCHVVIPPVDINIKVLGSFVGFDIANDTDRYLAYQLIPVEDYDGVHFGNLTLSEYHTNVQSVWRLESYDDGYTICTKRGLACINLQGLIPCQGPAMPNNYVYCPIAT